MVDLAPYPLLRWHRNKIKAGPLKQGGIVTPDTAGVNDSDFKCLF